jgi:hypothetical protein
MNDEQWPMNKKDKTLFIAMAKWASLPLPFHQ